MSKEEIIEKVKVDYECVLINFRVYDSAKELFKNEKENLSNFTKETEGKHLLEEENVFKVGEKFIYATEWHDAEWDD